MQAGQGRADDVPPPAPPPVARLGKKPSAAALVQRALATSVASVYRHLPEARRSGSTRSVHRTRVAVRRLRSDLQTFAPLLNEEWARSLRRDLGPVARDFAAARDADVMARLLRAVLVEERRDIGAVGGTGLLDLLAGDRAQAQDEVRRRFDADRIAALWAQLEAAAADPPLRGRATGPARTLTRPLVQKAWRRADRIVRGLPAEPDDRDLHRLRLATKRVRYAADAVVPVFGGDARKLAKAAGRVQRTLGRRQDEAVAVEWLGAAVARDVLVSSDAYAAGRIVEHLLRRDREAWRPLVRAMDRRSAWLQR